MNKVIKYSIYIIITIIIAFIILSLISSSQIREIKNISNLDAENAIANQYLNHIGLEHQKTSNDTLYTIAEIKFEKTNLSILNLSVKAGYAFYVFQNNHLTYSQDEHRYYKGFSDQKNHYNIIDSQFWEKKTLHKIPLHSHDPLYMIIKRPRAENISRLISLPNIIQKDIGNLVATNLPIITVNTHNNSLDTSQYKFTSTDFIFNQRTHSSFSKMKIRGNTSVFAPKKKFNIIFKESNKINGFMLKKNVLISSHIDRSFLRNKLADNLFSEFNQLQPSLIYTHLIINDIYEGLYLIAEHPEQQFQQLISDLDTNCFLLQIDRGPFDFYSSTSQGYKCEYPDRISSLIPKTLNWFENNIGDENCWFEEGVLFENNTEATDPFNVRVDYIVDRFGLSPEDSKNVVKKADYIMGQSNHNWIQSVKQKALKSGNTFYEQALEDASWLINQNNITNNISFKDHRRINIRSFIDLIILNEISKNIDGYRLSTYLSHIDNKFSVNIIWDFDLAWGLSKENKGFDYEGFIINSEMSQFSPSFWADLWNNKAFQEKLKKRYIELRQSVISNEEIDTKIDSIYTEINLSTKENFEIWQVLDKDIWPNKFHFESYEEEVIYLKGWILKRLSWLDSQWDSQI